ncbi:MAG: helix-turn-helix transcriptional regulator [Thermomicrobiales bacterium]
MTVPTHHLFRTWLLGELRLRKWTQSDLAKRLGVNRSAVAKWLAVEGTSSYRKPSYESCRALAENLGVPLETVLEAAQHQPVSLETTTMQQRVISLIPHIPDSVLLVIYHQLVPMIDAQIQDELLATLNRPHLFEN